MKTDTVLYEHVIYLTRDTVAELLLLLLLFTSLIKIQVQIKHMYSELEQQGWITSTNKGPIHTHTPKHTQHKVKQYKTVGPRLKHFLTVSLPSSKH